MYDSHSTLLLVSTIQFPSWAIDPLVTDQTLCAANAECSVLDMLTPDKCPEQIPIVSNIVDDTVVMAYNSANGTAETKDMDNECEFSGLFHGCKYTYQTLDKIKSNPAMFENNNKEDLEIMKNYIMHSMKTISARICRQCLLPYLAKLWMFLLYPRITIHVLLDRYVP